MSFPTSAPKRSTLNIGVQYGLDLQKMREQAAIEDKYDSEGRDDSGLNYAERAGRNMQIAWEREQAKYNHNANRYPQGEPAATTFARMNQAAYDAAQKVERGPYSPSSKPIPRVNCPECSKPAIKDGQYYHHMPEDLGVDNKHLTCVTFGNRKNISIQEMQQQRFDELSKKK